MKYDLDDILDIILRCLFFIMFVLATIVISLLLIAIIYTLVINGFDFSIIGGC